MVIKEILDDLIKSVESKYRENEQQTSQSHVSKLTPIETITTPSASAVQAPQVPTRSSGSNTAIAAAAAEAPSRAEKRARSPANFPSDSSCFYYFIKWIEFHNRKTPILLQNENGPCPLISICNCLLLRGQMKLEPNLELIENDKLIQILANLLLNECVPRFLTRQQRSAADEINLEQNISDALSIFESLQYGLNVNVRFSACTSFEYTRELDIFDLFSLSLYHGWLIDPEQTEFQHYLADKSYNQVVELSINNANTTNEERSYAKILADNFLESTASQLTYYGLHVLHSHMQPDELAILFRNNHFSTIYKCPQNNTLYTLVTDNGYLSHKNIVWETLENIEGDGRFCTSLFKDISSSASMADDDGDVIYLGEGQKAQCQNE